ncbi:hypothetical protein JCM10908_001006 [Rhodotorula pacifica]|uniref:uncharacterized protein n=1 Tax=Rhodotorula pacifica TaxID=1495444 RepID=UPI003180C596
MAAASPTTDNNNKHRGTAMMTSDELDWLVYSYLEESGYHHTSFSLLHESNLAGPPTSSSAGLANGIAPGAAAAPDKDKETNGGKGGAEEEPTRNPVMDKVVPPGHLVRLLQKALLYLEAEARYRRDPPDLIPRIVGYQIPTTLPLPPLPKYVPPPEPAATATPTATPKESTPPVASSSTSTAATTAPVTTLDTKGKGKAKAARATADELSSGEAPKKAKKKAAAAADSTSSVAPTAPLPEAGPSRKPATEAAPAPAKSANSTSSEPTKAPPATTTSNKGKERAVETDGDVQMEDATSSAAPVAAPRPNGRRASISGADAPPKQRKEKSAVPSSTSTTVSTPATGSQTSAKREREKDDLRPPPAKKTAAINAGTNGGSGSTAATAGQSATATAKRSASPSVPRKSKPSDSTNSTSSSSSLPPAGAPTVSIAPSASSTTSALPPGPTKFRITTTTKTVSTPVAHSPLGAGSGGPPISAAQLAADKRRRGSGENNSTAAKDAGATTGDRLLKVKTEAAAANDPALSSPSPTSSGASAPTAATNGTTAGSGSGAMGKNGLGGTGPKSPIKPPSPLKEFDMRGVREIKDDDPRVVRLKGHTVAKIQPCAFNSKVPSLLATGGGDSTCRIWDVPPFSPPGAKSQATVTEHIVCKHQSAQRRCDITCVAWNPSGSLLATGSEDGIVRIWTPSGDLHLVLSMHQRQVCSLKWNPMGTMLLTSSLDQTVCLWEVSSGKVRQQYATHADTVLDVDWNDDQTWASASMDKTVHLMSLSRTTPLHRFRGHRDEVNVVKFSPCGTLVASCSDDSTVRIWSLRNIPAVSRDIAVKQVPKGDESRRIDRDEEDGGAGGVFVLEGHDSDVHQIAWHPDAGKPTGSGPRLLASCSFDSTARLWDADAGTCLYTFARASDYVYSIAFEPVSGRYVATGSNDGRLDIYRVEDRALVTEYKHTGPIYEITWHPHGQQIAVCGQSDIVGVVGFEPGKAAA